MKRPLRITVAMLLLVMMFPGLLHASDSGVIAPSWWSPQGPDWDKLVWAARYVPTIAIPNVNSGPGSSFNPDWAGAINQVRAQPKGKAIGYVRTIHANRPITDVKNDITLWSTWYNLDGIFLDEMSDNIANVAYYHELYDYCKAIDPNWTVAANPGSNVPREYMDTTTADIINIFETQQDYSFTAWTPSNWVYGFDKSQFSSIVYNADTTERMEECVDWADSHNIGWMFIEDPDSPISNHIPPYWYEEISKICAINGDPAPPPIPEPSTQMLLGIAGLSMLGYLWKKDNSLTAEVAEERREMKCAIEK